MKKLLNTLYVSTQGAYLRKEGLALVVEIEREVRFRAPLHNLHGIVCFGNVMCSPFLLGACGQAGVQLSFLTRNGRFLADVRGEVTGNVLLRREQYRQADDPIQSLQMMRWFILAKLLNARHSLRRAIRDGHGNPDLLSKACLRLKRHIGMLEHAETADVLRGLEGEAAKSYFNVINELMVQQKDTFHWQGRNRRPPTDPINALLSYIYTLLLHDIAGALSAHGLDPFVGFLHRDRPGRRSLALDVLEEFRTSFADRLAITLVNRKQLQEKHFDRTDSGAVLLSEDGRKILIDAYQKRKQDEVKHPFLEETIQVGMLWHAQALLMARYLRGDMDAYPPMVWK